MVMVDEVAPPSFPFTYDLDSGTVVAIKAVPRFGYDFNGWGGDLSGADNPAILTIDCNKNITATFSLDWLLIGSAAVGLVAAVLLVSVLIFRRKTPESDSPPVED